MSRRFKAARIRLPVANGRIGWVSCGCPRVRARVGARTGGRSAGRVRRHGLAAPGAGARGRWAAGGVAQAGLGQDGLQFLAPVVEVARN